MPKAKKDRKNLQDAENIANKISARPFAKSIKLQILTNFVTAGDNFESNFSSICSKSVFAAMKGYACDHVRDHVHARIKGSREKCLNVE